METDARLTSGLIDRRIHGGLDPEFIGGLHKNQPMIADWNGIAAKKIGIDLQRSRHFRRGSEIQLRPAVHYIHIVCGDGLSVFNDVDVSASPWSGGEDLQPDAFAGTIYGTVGAQQNLVRSRPRLE